MPGKPKSSDKDDSGPSILALGDAELARLLVDEDRSLRSRLEEIDPDLLKTLPTHHESREGGIQNERPEEQSIFTVEALAPREALPGLYFNVVRKGSGHNDPNWGRIGAPKGACNHGYAYHHFVSRVNYSVRFRANYSGRSGPWLVLQLDGCRAVLLSSLPDSAYGTLSSSPPGLWEVWETRDSRRFANARMRRSTN